MEKLTEYVDGKYIRIKGTKSLYPKNERDGAPLSNAIAKAPLPAVPTKREKEERECKAIGMRVVQELRAGIDGLHAFIDNFAGVDILSDDERDLLDRVLYTASGFADGVETGIALRIGGGNT